MTTTTGPELAYRVQWGRSVLGVMDLSLVKSLSEPASQRGSRATAARPAGWGMKSLGGAARTVQESKDFDVFADFAAPVAS